MSPKKEISAPMIIGIVAIVVFVIVVILNLAGSSSSKNNTALKPGAPSTWYYVTPDLKCVQVPQQYSNEDSCQNAMGSYCFMADPTCNNANQTTTLYYINSTNQCVVAPGNPYSVVLKSGNITAGVLAEQDNCQSAVGTPCFNDKTCMGVGNPGTVTIQGVPYKLVSVNELINNVNNPGFVGNLGSTSTMSEVAVQGTITNVIQLDKTAYGLIIDTGSGSAFFSIGIIDPNTEGPNGVDISAYPVGSKVLAGGIFLGGKILTLENEISSVPQLGKIGLPSNTPIIVNAGGGVRVVN